MMSNRLKKELFYGTRALVRDNWLNGYLRRQVVAQGQWSAEQLERLQRRRLYRTMQRAIATLPFYAHISPDFPESQAYTVLRRDFPIIDKRTLLAHRATLYPNQGRNRPWQAVGKSSGTTGTPLAMFRSIPSVLMEMAFVKRQWEWNGVREGMRRASLRGDVVTELARNEPPFWFWNRYNNQLLVSSRHLKEPYMGAIADQLQQFAPAMLQAYPSTAYTLAQYLERHDRRLAIPLVFTSSEPLYPHQRALIEARLGGKVRDMYGMAERVAFATECEFGAMHINPDYSLVEIVDDDGQPTDDYGAVVGTTLCNLAMPLLRYRLSDRSRWKKGQCACGRHFPMIEAVTGKFEDQIFGSDGAAVSPSVLTFAFKGVDNILKSQVAQVAPGRWQIRIVPGAAFSEADRVLLVENVHALVDPGIDVEVLLFPELANTASGKFRWVVNESVFS